MKGSTLLFLITWFGTFEFWKRSLPYGIPLGYALEAALHFAALSSVPMVVVNIYNSYKYKTGKMRPLAEAARPFFPFLIYLTLFMYWAFKSPNNVIELDTRAVYLLAGTIFSNISVSGVISTRHALQCKLNMIVCFLFQCRLIVAQMSNTRCEAVHWMTPIIVLSIIISFVIPLLERPLVYLLVIFSSLAHWHYGAKVVRNVAVYSMSFDLGCY